MTEPLTPLMQVLSMAQLRAMPWRTKVYVYCTPEKQPKLDGFYYRTCACDPHFDPRLINLGVFVKVNEDGSFVQFVYKCKFPNDKQEKT
jgi:hypothetical protein